MVLFFAALVAYLGFGSTAYRLAQVCAVAYPLAVIFTWPWERSGITLLMMGPLTATLACAVIAVTAGAARSANED